MKSGGWLMGRSIAQVAYGLDKGVERRGLVGVLMRNPPCAGARRGD